MKTFASLSIFRCGLVFCALAVVSASDDDIAKGRLAVVESDAVCMPEGKSLRFSWSWDEVKNTSSWAGTTGTAIPLSIAEAVAAAAKDKTEYVSNPDAYRLYMIKLVRFQTDHDKWVWVIHFKKPGPRKLYYPNERPGQPAIVYGPSDLCIPVLMSGRTLRGKEGRRVDVEKMADEISGDSDTTGKLSVSNRGPVEFEVSGEELKHTPTWRWEIDDPLPLSIERSVAIASRELKRYGGDIAKYQLAKTSLERFKESDYWVHWITFLKVTDSSDFTAETAYMTLGVLMSGNPINEKRAR